MVHLRLGGAQADVLQVESIMELECGGTIVTINDLDICNAEDYCRF